MKIKDANNGFTLTEVVVSMTILSILILGITFTFQTIAKMNNISAKKDIANSLASSIVENLSTYTYESINKNILESINFPSYIDSTKMNVEVVDYDNVDEETSIEPDTYSTKKAYKLTNIEGNLSDFDIILKLDSNYPYEDSENNIKDLNKKKYPLISFLNNEDTFVVNDRLDVTTWKKDEDGKYEYLVDDLGNISHEYKVDTISSYDQEAINEFKRRNEQGLNNIYAELIKKPENEGSTFNGLGLNGLRITDDDYKRIMKKKTILSIDKKGTDVFYKVQQEVIYKIDIEKIKDLGSNFQNEYYNEMLFGKEASNLEYKKVTSTKKFLELNTIYILFWQSEFIENYTIENNADTKLDLFWIYQSKYDTDKILGEILSGEYKTKVNLNGSFLGINYTQTSDSLDLLTLYTNCNLVEGESLNSTKINGDNIRDLTQREQNVDVRLYKLNIEVYDENGNLFLNATSANLMGK